METKRYGAKFIIMSHRQWVQRKKKGQLWGTLQKVLESQKALCVWGRRGEAWQPPLSQDTRSRPGRKQHGDGGPTPWLWDSHSLTTTTHTGSIPLIRVQTQSKGRCPSRGGAPIPPPGSI